ncbi:hypothetical protein Zmor_009326 [Zophobas morio]|uniref:Glycerate kinase n=1 Tax=Zophobas morio TaxID=2755281 RepID=A0AA38MHL1_9CUCU|nr:hypothetical protein Zmor_009326 [Zophobas morio]
MFHFAKPHPAHPFTRKMSIQPLKEIFLKSVESVQPHHLIPSQVHVTNSHLSIQNRSYPLHKPCYLVGFGKAVLGMSLELEKLLKDKLNTGLVTVPSGILSKFKVESRIKFIEGAPNNIPDEAALRGALEIKTLAEGLGADDLLVVVMSGGGSALLPLPKPPITLQEKQDLIKALSTKGADILELNCVRKQISVLKGGGLAELAYPARVVTLVLSDVVGDPLGFIASGPTYPTSDDEDAAAILDKYGCHDLPDSIKTVLTQKKTKQETIIHNGRYDHVDTFIIGNNVIAAEAACRHAASLGFQTAILSTSVAGSTHQLSQTYADLAAAIADPSDKQPLKNFLQKCDLPICPDFADAASGWDLGAEVCVIAAGEPTVVVNGGGRGGRNQQLALELSVRLNKLNIKSADISFLSGGTDGIDGPTDAAGAIGTSDLVNNGLEENIKAEDYLNNNDSYGFYSRLRGGEFLIKIGHTGTNVMDVHVMLVKPRRAREC